MRNECESETACDRESDHVPYNLFRRSEGGARPLRQARRLPEQTGE